MKTATRLRSTFMRVMASPLRERQARWRARTARRLRRQPPVVHYFHELADPYSHLAVQKLDAMREHYTLEFRVHLTSPERAAYRGDADRYPAWAIRDARDIAPGFGVSFPEDATWPEVPAVNAAASALDRWRYSDEFASRALAIGNELWSGAIDAQGNGSDLFEAGNQLRNRLGHYAGGMFWFDGEWYWGLDRLELLERRLIEEGYGTGDPVVPRPTFKAAPGAGEGLVLEVFPSLRSPYTAISFDLAMEIVDRTGVTLNLRPVMPMMMRGVPAPTRKGGYIMFDAAREGRRYGVPFGKVVDPFGDPVKLAYSLYPLAEARGKARAFVSRYLAAAWAEGIDITGAKGLREVMEDIGIDWRDAEPMLGGSDAEPMLEANVADMLAAGLWGVPSFRLTGGDAPAYSCWGQDRLWRIEQEIASRAGAR